MSEHAAATLLGPSCGLPQTLELNLLGQLGTERQVVTFSAGEPAPNQPLRTAQADVPSGLYQLIL